MEKIKGKINLYVECVKKFNTFYLCICFVQPLEKETAAKNRLIPMALGCGSEKYNTITALNSVLAEMYGAKINFQTIKKGGSSVLQFMISAPNGSEERAFELLSELLNRPLVINGELADKKDELKNMTADKAKRAYAFEKCAEMMFDGRGFGVNADGTAEDIEKAEKLYEHWQYIYKNSAVNVFVLGNISAEHAQKLTDRYFPGLVGRDIKYAEHKPNVCGICREKADITQAKLCIGLDMGEGSRFEKQIYNEIIAGTDSRLFNELREKQNLCYYVGGTFYSLANVAFIEAGIRPESLEKVLDTVKILLDKPVTVGETELAKRIICAGSAAIWDHPAALMDFYLTQSMFGDPVSPEEAAERIRSVSETAVKPRICTVYMLGGETNDKQDLVFGA